MSDYSPSSSFENELEKTLNVPDISASGILSLFVHLQKFIVAAVGPLLPPTTDRYRISDGGARSCVLVAFILLVTGELRWLILHARPIIYYVSLTLKVLLLKLNLLQTSVLPLKLASQLHIIVQSMILEWVSVGSLMDPAQYHLISL